MLEKHHIVFKSQGGLDFELNYKHLTSEQHRGNDGPHLNKKTDLKYKLELQEKLETLFDKSYYQVDELVDILGLKEQQAAKAFRKVPVYRKGMRREDVIRRLMGGRVY